MKLFNKTKLSFTGFKPDVLLQTIICYYHPYPPDVFDHWSKATQTISSLDIQDQT